MRHSLVKFDYAKLNHVVRLHVGLRTALREVGRSCKLALEVEQELGARWLAEITSLPGVQVYGQTRTEAIERAKALALRVLADRVEHGEPTPQMDDLFTVVP